jgi:hypothetical protein
VRGASSPDQLESSSFDQRYLPSSSGCGNEWYRADNAAALALTYSRFRASMVSESRIHEEGHARTGGMVARTPEGFPLGSRRRSLSYSERRHRTALSSRQGEDGLHFFGASALFAFPMDAYDRTSCVEPDYSNTVRQREQSLSHTPDTGASQSACQVAFRRAPAPPSQAPPAAAFGRRIA